MPKVRSLSLAGKSVNVPHLEHRNGGDKNVVTFGEDGVAEVSATLRDSLLEFYPRDVEAVQSKSSK